MWSDYQLVKEAIENLNLGFKEIEELEPSEAQKIIKNIKNRFVNGDPRAWWLSLKLPFKSYPINDVSDKVDYLNKLLPSSELSYLWILDGNNKDYHVFKATLNSIKSIILESPYFEYYIVHHNLDWLLAENDHGEVIISLDTKFSCDIPHHEPPLFI